MKKIRSAILVLTLILTAFSGCAASQPSNSTNDPTVSVSQTAEVSTEQSSQLPAAESSAASKQQSPEASVKPSSASSEKQSSQPSEPNPIVSSQAPSSTSSSAPSQEPSVSQLSAVSVAAPSEVSVEQTSVVPAAESVEPTPTPQSSIVSEVSQGTAAPQQEQSSTSTSQPAPAAPEADASDFVVLTDVVPDVILEIRYYSTYNFVGDRIDGYEQPTALITKEAAYALKRVSDDMMRKGYRLKIFDAYRPQKAVSHFVRWAKDLNDTRMKSCFYPGLDKSVLFPQGYISERSGHSRGSTVDLTLFDMKTGKEVDMGGTFDYFGELSHPDYSGITEEQYRNRMMLREAMTANGFKPLFSEWWHFTLQNEPYPNTYFTFPVSEKSVK